jgi:hypothetical protein
MSLNYEGLLDNSIQAALSSIEIYNKPDFKYREQVFVVLNVNAWELLLKAKIVKDAGDNLTSLYILEQNGKYKTKPSGNYFTISITDAINKLISTKYIEATVQANLEQLIEIRDTVIHFYHNQPLAYLVYTLGSASLRNYQTLIKKWFNKNLLEYNFYILPLAFAYNFQRLSVLDLEKEPELIANLIQSAATTQAKLISSEEFHFICEIETQIISAKKLIGDADFTTTIDTKAEPETPIVIKKQDLLDLYPVNYSALIEKVKKAKPNAKNPKIDQIKREHKLKDNPSYSTYVFNSQEQREEYKKTGNLPKGIQSLYNEDAVRYIIAHIED